MQFLFGTFLLLFLFELVSFFFNLLLVALFCSFFFMLLWQIEFDVVFNLFFERFNFAVCCVEIASSLLKKFFI